MWLLYSTTVFLTFYLSEGATYTYDHAGGYLRDVDQDWTMVSGRTHQPKCIDIPDNLSLCRGIGYFQMRLPNLLGHDSINEVIQQAKSWVPLLGVRCNPDTQLFLCSLFSPVCLDREIYPCRSLCESVKAGCEQRMGFYGYEWPEMVWCNKFPNDSDLCIKPMNRTEPEQTRNVCSACEQPETYEGLVDNYCRATYVMQAKISKIKERRNVRQLRLKPKKKMIKKDGISKRERRRMSPVMEANCTCDRITLNASQKYIIMGNKTASGHYTVSYIGLWNKKNKAFRRAVRKMRKLRKKNSDQCMDIIDIGDKKDNAIDTGTGREEGKNRRKRKRNRKNRKRNKRKRGRKRDRNNNRGSNAVTVPNSSG